jgi:hypothetical protein
MLLDPGEEAVQGRIDHALTVNPRFERAGETLSRESDELEQEWPQVQLQVELRVVLTVLPAVHVVGDGTGHGLILPGIAPRGQQTLGTT